MIRSRMKDGGGGAAVRGGGISLLLVFVLAASAWGAKPRSDLANFLGVLRQHGYADFAVEYLEAHKDDPALPEDVRETWDIEMSNCLWIASTQTGNDGEAQRKREEAQKYLEKFAKEHPGHPAMAEAMITWGTTSLEEGIIRAQLAKATSVDAEKEVHLKEARTLLTDAREKFAKGVEAYRTLNKELGAGANTSGDAEQGKEPGKKKPAATKKTPAEKPSADQEAAADAAFHLTVARFKLALADYWLAQTCDDSQKEERAAKLKAASDVFDEIYHNYRGELAGWIAHYWQAKILSETKDTEDGREEALEICDEVLVISPDTVNKNQIDPAVLGLVGDTMVLRIDLLAKSDQAAMAVDEASTWLNNNTSVQNTAAYQAVVLQWVKTLSANMNVISEARKRHAAERAMVTRLTSISRTRGPYQREAALLLAKVNKRFSSGPKVKGESLVEVLAAADSALVAEQWASAAEQYEQASKLLPEAKITAEERKKREVEIRDRLAQARFRIAVELATTDKLKEATEAAEKIMRDSPQSPAAPAAAALAMQVLQKMVTAPDLEKEQKEALMAKLQKLAEGILSTWPNNPEADDARYTLGTIHLLQSKQQLPEDVQHEKESQAVRMLTAVQRTSPRYSAAMNAAGEIAWARYRSEMEKPAKDRNAQVIEKTLQSALKWLTAAADAEQPAAEAEKDPQRAAAQRQMATYRKLRLAEVLMASGKTKEAMSHYQQIMEAGLSGEGAAIDAGTLRALGMVLKANLSRGDFDKASELAVELGKRAGDQAQINEMLVTVLKFLVHDVRKAEAEVTTQADSKDDSAIAKAAEWLQQAQKRTAALLAILAPQKEHSVPTKLFIADSCIRVGMKAEGQQLYQQILTVPNLDSTAETRIRARLIGMLTDEKKYTEALRQVDLLLKDHPKALDLLVQRGKILQILAKTDPRQYDEAVAQWNSIRTMLAGMPQKPPEYYEAIYNTADCLITKSQRDKNPESALQAAKLLNGVLVLSPDLNGPDTVARFKSLIKKATAMQSAPGQPKR